MFLPIIMQIWFASIISFATEVSSNMIFSDFFFSCSSAMLMCCCILSCLCLNYFWVSICCFSISSWIRTSFSYNFSTSLLSTLFSAYFAASCSCSSSFYFDCSSIFLMFSSLILSSSWNCFYYSIKFCIFCYSFAFISSIYCLYWFSSSAFSSFRACC